MALPLKSGADLYTQELLRARLHNFDGDLAEYGTGSIYFNTTSGLNTSDRIRYRGLAGWHSVANLEDIARLEEMIGNLDFAGSEDFIGITSRVAALEGNFTNGAAKDAVKFGGQLPSYYATQSAFSALQEKVNAFLDGDVDSDAVLENLKEIQTFLDSYDGATSLVDLLDAKADKSQLSGYLPLSGGELNGGLIIKNNSGLYFKDTSGKGILALYVNSTNKLILGAGAKETGYSTYIEGTNVYVNNNFCINSSGNVGIGTASPTQKLDVRGNQYITGYIYADGDLNTGQWLKTSTGVALGTAHTLTFNSYSIISNAELSFTNISTTDISTGIRAAIKAGLMQINDIIGHRIFLGNNTAGTASNQPFSICTYSGVSNYAPANVTELFRVDPTGEVTIKQDLIVEGNVIAYGQVSAGGVGEEGGTSAGVGLEKKTFTIPANSTSFECEHNLGTKEISVSIYEEGGDYQQILADVYLDSTNIARIVFGRATDVAHKVVIIG